MIGVRAPLICKDCCIPPSWVSSWIITNKNVIQQLQDDGLLYLLFAFTRFFFFFNTWFLQQFMYFYFRISLSSCAHPPRFWSNFLLLCVYSWSLCSATWTWTWIQWSLLCQPQSYSLCNCGRVELRYENSSWWNGGRVLYPPLDPLSPMYPTPPSSFPPFLLGRSPARSPTCLLSIWCSLLLLLLYFSRHSRAQRFADSSPTAATRGTPVKFMFLGDSETGKTAICNRWGLVEETWGWFFIGNGSFYLGNDYDYDVPLGILSIFHSLVYYSSVFVVAFVIVIGDGKFVLVMMRWWLWISSRNVTILCSSFFVLLAIGDGQFMLVVMTAMTCRSEHFPFCIFYSM